MAALAALAAWAAVKYLLFFLSQAILCPSNVPPFLIPPLEATENKKNASLKAEPCQLTPSPYGVPTPALLGVPPQEWSPG